MLHNWNEVEKLQPRVFRLLQNAIIKKRVAHAYLFEGSRGIGRYACALLLAKALLCLQKKDKPCNECHNCIRIDTGNHPDIIHVKPDGSTIKKEQIQLLQKEFSYSSYENDKKIYIIEEADKMTNSAANSLLKFLEEPVSDSIAILLTERSSAMLTTIVSRCQVIKFSSLPSSLVEEALSEYFIFGEEAKVLSKLTSDVTEASKISEEHTLGPKLKMVQEFIEKSRTVSVYTLKNQLADAFKGKQETHLFFQLVILWYEDLLNYHTNRTEHLTFNETTVQNVANIYNIATVLRLIQCTQKYQKRVHSNVGFNSLFDGFIAEIHGL